MAGNLGFPSLLSGQPVGGPAQPFATQMNPGNPADYMYNVPGTETSFYPYGEGMDFGVGSPGFGGSGYPYGTGMDFGRGSPGFPAPAAPGGYPYGTGMDFGVGSPGFPAAGPDPRIAQEAERNRLEAERNRLEAERGGMNFGLTDIRDNRIQEEYARRVGEERRRWDEENARSVNAGAGGLIPYVESGILAGEAFSPGDMGDAITNQQHEYMGAARAEAQREAEYQQRVQAERAAIDASIAAAAAQSNAWNPQYNLQTNFNQNVAGLNPSSIFDKWASGQSTQYQSY